MSSEQLLAQPIKIEQFDGPFHVLVELLNSKELDITEVNLSEITEQYIEAVNNQRDTDPYTLADFLVVASRLIYLKSKTILPMLLPEDEDEESVANLEDQLKMYKRFYEASKTIGEMIDNRNIMHVREKIAVDVGVLFNPPHAVTGEKMRDIFASVVNGLEPIVKIPEKVIKRVVSLSEKMNQIRERILNKMNANFSELLNGAEGKPELVVTFLAVLELVKQKVLIVDQDELHGDITITKKTD